MPIGVVSDLLFWDPTLATATICGAVDVVSRFFLEAINFNIVGTDEMEQKILMGFEQIFLMFGVFYSIISF